MKFIVDGNVGKIAKWLRMAGFDAILFSGKDDVAMIAAALADDRILLTRDRRLMRRRAIASGTVRALLLAGDRLPDQARQLVAALGLDPSRFHPFTRCLECNRPLEMRPKESIRERVPPYVYLTQGRFAECPACRRLYWPGSHRPSMIRGMGALPADGSSPGENLETVPEEKG